MRLTSRTVDGRLIVTVAENRIDAASAIAFKEALRSLTDGFGGAVILGLDQVDFVDSSGLGAIVAAMKQLGGERRLHLAGLTPNVDRVFRLTRMDTVFPMHANVEAAVEQNDS